MISIRRSDRSLSGFGFRALGLRGGAVGRLVASLVVAGALCGCSGEAPARDPFDRSVPQRPNVLLISLDALRADRLGAYGSLRDTSPFLDRLAQEGRLYRTAFTVTHGTPPAHASLFSSLYQETHRVSWTGKRSLEGDSLPPGLPLLPEALNEAGWSTLAVTGGGFVSSAFGFDRGFERFEEGFGVERGARRLLREVQSRQDDDRPIFAFFHTYEIHSPYAPPPRFRDLYLGPNGGHWLGQQAVLDRFRTRADDLRPGELETISRLYDGGVRYTDDVLARLWRDLESTGFLDHALVIITSDHGEEMGEHGGLQHPAHLYEELIRVPLIVWARGPVGDRLQPGIDERLATLLDVAPTIYAALGVDPPPLGDSIEMAGHDLLGPPPRWSRIFAQYGRLVYAVRERRFKLVETRGKVRLFDLEADPGETVDVAAEFPRRTRDLRRRLRNWKQRVPPPLEAPKPSSQPDAETLERLRSLGYL